MQIYVANIPITFSAIIKSRIWFSSSHMFSKLEEIILQVVSFFFSDDYHRSLLPINIIQLNTSFMYLAHTQRNYILRKQILPSFWWHSGKENGGGFFPKHHWLPIYYLKPEQLNNFYSTWIKIFSSASKEKKMWEENVCLCFLPHSLYNSHVFILPKWVYFKLTQKIWTV